MSAKTRAERFEDEKRRIVESCFGKRDEDGSLLESYITHIRVTEDAAHPSAPPPPDAPQAGKKVRVIVVAVRKSGRVRMHKARENANGTFSIGKTWVLDDLTQVQSFANSIPGSIEEEQQKQWAGPVGFTVTISKPYYWQAATAKEKDFFIASLLKIFKKYTGGRVPELIGFDAREMEQLAGAPGASPQISRDSPMTNGSHTLGSVSPQSRPSSSNAPKPPPIGPRSPSRSFRQGSSQEQFAPRPSQDQSSRRPSHEQGSSSTYQSSSRRPSANGPGRLDRTRQSHDRAMTPEVQENESFMSAKSDRATTPSLSTVPTNSTPEPPPEPPQEESHRPGLGPMLKKKSNRDVAGAFRKAATAYNAFMPRAGGVGERLRQQKESSSNEPDGITGVVPAPSLLKSPSKADGPRTGTPDSIARERAPSRSQEDQVPEVTVTAATRDKVGDRPVTPIAQSPKPRQSSPQKARSQSPKSQEARRQKRRSDARGRCLAALDIDTSVIPDTASDIEAVLRDFGWEGETTRTKKIDELEAELRREIGRAGAGSWLGHLEQKDERVTQVEKMLDRAIAECDELEGLLTLYSVELSTLNEDISYIEAQSQGLQVQTANQRLLQTELQNLLQTISISPKQLQALHDSSLESTRGLEAVENALVVLYRAMVTIDPSLRSGTVTGKASTDGSSIISGGYGANEIGQMRALQEKKEGYRNECVHFMRRLRPFIEQQFQNAVREGTYAAEHDSEGSLGRRPSKTKVHSKVHEVIWNELWRYSPLMHFTREVDKVDWEEMMRMYEKQVRGIYQREFREGVSVWQRMARRPTGDEQDLLFTTQEKETEGGIATTARKLTVKRSQTLAKTLRSEKSDVGRTTPDRSQDGKLHPYEAFTAALDDLVPLVFKEQNFVVDFFHASSLQQTEFPDIVAAAPPEGRVGTNLKAAKMYDPDRSMGKSVTLLMEDMYTFWPVELQNMVDWAIKADPLQGVGLLLALERRLATLSETNQEFLLKTLSKVHQRLSALFARFVDEQVRGIEDTKVKIKKRKGVIGFVKVFPHFATAIENMLPSAEFVDDEDGGVEVREMVDGAYERINKAMFDALQAIARDGHGPGALRGSGQGPPVGGGDPEDKEALNYHILLIENMNHYVEEVEPRGNVVLQSWVERAKGEMSRYLAAYLGAVIRRPLGKLLDTIESTESLTAALSATTPASSISHHPSHSPSSFRKLLSAHDARELRRGIDALKKRVEKHFGEGDADPVLARALVQTVLQECEAMYLGVVERVGRIARDVYAGEVAWEVGADEVRGAFRR
ncbi:MAG: hypothetical protein M1817_005874 [Caeruleum heppii]|nr:MAG: hypothetical protein M1817_005874 [Caeruleum heppii]